MVKQWENLDRTHPSFPLPFRLYEGSAVTKSQPLVLYLRGTAFMEEERPEVESAAARAIADAGAKVVEADYCSVSGNVFPRALECVFGAFMALIAKRKRFGLARSQLLVAGDESGGNLAASVALKARDHAAGELAGQILLSPMIDPRMATLSFRQADQIKMRVRWSDGWSHYLRSACGFEHPYAAPCLCSRLSGVAPALVVTSENDPLRDEALGYGDRLASAGVEVIRQVLPPESGWTGIYKGESGAWTSQLCPEFSKFMRGLKT
ncbi:alpha/beta hydrolase fold domain-containing protein [Rhizobium oryzicola]|uniref:Alpha/beta hydrolase n=1 Tax=Rhizobium oryzicola TaxID=1232668 RepID=A0ABT8T4D9_9HYPH|nr:alpha/beta hydrolase [Rhizobium oryzicola]MDO1585289.1 alpha/beta hydrolase [Rhizobium oryzicola]